MERCPNCRARYRGDAECHRCGMALSLLIEIEAQAERWERYAAQQLLLGNKTAAADAARRCLDLQWRPLAVLLHDFANTLKPSR